MPSLRIHFLQHVPFEGLGSIAAWAEKHDSVITSTQLFQNQTLPAQQDFDWLIIMGGPMNIYEDALYPWLAAEKAFIRQTIASNKVIFGVCLGAQLIADALGAKVYRNQTKEIGWFPVSFLKTGVDSRLKERLPETLTVMHWHGDTFTMPEGAVHLARSPACENQGFIFQEKVFALQFHLETTAESLTGLIENCRDEICNGEFIQTAKAMVEDNNFTEINETMGIILEYLKKNFWEPR